MITTIIYLIVISASVLADVSNSNDKRTSQNKIETFGGESPAQIIRDLNQLDKTNNGLDSAKGFPTDRLSNVPDFNSLPTLDTLSKFSDQNVQKQGQSVTYLQSTKSQDLLHSSLSSKANEQYQPHVVDRSSIPSAFRNQPRISQRKSNSGLAWNDPSLISKILNQINEILFSASQSSPEHDSTSVNQNGPYYSLNNNQFEDVADLYRQFHSSNIELNDVLPYRPNQMSYNDPGTTMTRLMDQYPNQMDQMAYPSSQNDHYLHFGRPYYLPERDMHFPSIDSDRYFRSRYIGDLSFIPRYTPGLDQHDFYYPRAGRDRTIINSRQQNRFPSRIQIQSQSLGSRFGRNLGLVSRDTYWDSN